MTVDELKSSKEYKTFFRSCWIAKPEDREVAVLAFADYIQDHGEEAMASLARDNMAAFKDGKFSATLFRYDTFNVLEMMQNPLYMDIQRLFANWDRYNGGSPETVSVATDEEIA